MNIKGAGWIDHKYILGDLYLEIHSPHSQSWALGFLSWIHTWDWGVFVSIFRLWKTSTMSLAPCIESWMEPRTCIHLQSQPIVLNLKSDIYWLCELHNYLSLSVPQFPHLYNKDDNRIYLKGCYEISVSWYKLCRTMCGTECYKYLLSKGCIIEILHKAWGIIRKDLGKWWIWGVWT